MRRRSQASPPRQAYACIDADGKSAEIEQARVCAALTCVRDASRGVRAEHSRVAVRTHFSSLPGAGAVRPRSGTLGRRVSGHGVAAVPPARQHVVYGRRTWSAAALRARQVCDRAGRRDARVAGEAAVAAGGLRQRAARAGPAPGGAAARGPEGADRQGHAAAPGPGDRGGVPRRARGAAAQACADAGARAAAPRGRAGRRQSRVRSLGRARPRIARRLPTRRRSPAASARSCARRGSTTAS